MFPLAFLLSVVQVPPSQWTAVPLNVPQNRTTVHASYTVENGATSIQAIVVTRRDAERFHVGRSIRPLFMSGFQKSNRFRVYVPDAGDYVLLLDNRLEGRFAAKVDVRIEMTHPEDVHVSTVSPERRRATVALSLLFFGAVVVFTATRFL